MLTCVRPLHYLWQAISKDRRPSQIAWGIAIGFLVGLIPKGNLTAWLFGTLLFALRVNIGAGLLTALLVASVSSWLDPLTHGIGLRLLQTKFVHGSFVSWYELPLVPWLGFNNTVTLGSTVLGLALLLPLQHIAEAIVRSCQAKWPNSQTAMTNARAKMSEPTRHNATPVLAATGTAPSPPLQRVAAERPSTQANPRSSKLTKPNKLGQAIQSQGWGH